ncbi:MAG: general secretion pathway protein GspB [Desulfocapsaceae bacterium]|nr:general secretion pathway protein GspB [Desulfocapsaceae bacterium]
MSYILEALQKSEKERKQDEVLVLQSVFIPRQVLPTGKNMFTSNRLWALAVLAFLVFIPGALVGWEKLSGIPLETNNLIQEITALFEHRKASIPAQQVEPATAFTTTAAPPTMGLPRTIIQQPAPPILGKDDDSPVIERKLSDIPVSANLPLSVQEEIREMKFAGHVYSENPSLRMIIINDKILHENDVIDADFRLYQITRRGVVLLYNSKRLAINIF